MPAKKNVSRMLHVRINELLDRILEKQNEEFGDRSLTSSGQMESDHLESDHLESGQSHSTQAGSSQLNLGGAEEPLMVSMESFFEFNFDLTGELDQWVDEKLEQDQLDAFQRHWETGFETIEFPSSDEVENEQSKKAFFKRPK